MERLVIIAGGDPTQLAALGRSLLRHGLDTFVAQDGREAMLKLVQCGASATTEDNGCSVQALFLDAGLPDTECEQVLRAIRESSTTQVPSDMPVFVFSADTGPDNQQRFFKAGATDLLPKPLTPRAVSVALGEGTPSGDGGTPAPGSAPQAMRLRTETELIEEFEITREETGLLCVQMVKETPEAIQALLNATDTGDLTATARAAHFLAGSLLSILCVGPARAARNIEQSIVSAPRPPHPDQLRQAAASLATAVEDLLEQARARWGE